MCRACRLVFGPFAPADITDTQPAINMRGTFFPAWGHSGKRSGTHEQAIAPSLYPNLCPGSHLLWRYQSIFGPQQF